ncbi:MAG: helical backbone metal receptor, partial [Syntrophorhabdaceae bacterium]|nr:helical backbone metal receptor [Syntrophorhabdaceae bacterium]
DIEKIVSLMPDMVFGSQEGNPPWLMDRLKRLGIKTHYFKRPKGFKDLSDNFLALGKMLNREDRAREIIKKAAIALSRQSNYSPFKVLWQVGSDPFIAATDKSFINDIIMYGGGINIIETGIPYSRINIEEVIKKKPDVIVLMDMGYSIDGEINRWRGLLGDCEFLIIDAYVASSPTPLTFVEAVEMLREKGKAIRRK